MPGSRCLRMMHVLLAAAFVQVACQPQMVTLTETQVVEREAIKAVEQEAPAAPVDITLLWPSSNSRLDQIVNDLNQASGTYKIELVPAASWAEYWAVLDTRIAAGDPPDLMRMDQSYLSRLAAEGSLLEIGACEDVDPDHPALDFGDYLGVALDAYTYLGGRHGLPDYMVPQVLYVNEGHLAEAGIKLDGINGWTWSDLQEVSAALTSEYRYGFLGYDGFQLDGFADPIGDWRTMMKSGGVSMVMDWADMDYEAAEGQTIAAYLLPQDSSGNRDTAAYIGGISIAATTQYPDVACQAFLDLVQALHDSDAFAPRKSLLTAGRIASMLSYKAGTSAGTIVASAESMHGMAWVSAPEADIGAAQLVPGNPMMFAGASALRSVLDQGGAKVNVASTVRIPDGDQIVHLAPVSPEGIPRGTSDLWPLLEERGGLLVGVLVSANGSFAVQIGGSARAPEVILIGPEGTQQRADEGTVDEVGESANVPFAGIDQGSLLCRLAFDGLKSIFRCG